MRLIKAQSTNARSIKGKGLQFDIKDVARMGGDVSMVVPIGPTSTRPVFPENGMMRYNTDLDSFESYQKTTAPTINHFYEKLLLLKNRINTKSAKKIAEDRHLFMEQFLQNFLTDWNLNK